MQPQGLDLITIIHQGAIATYPLIFLSIISVTVVFERLWSLRNMSAVTLKITESLLDPLKKGQRDLAVVICKQNSDCPAARIFLNILNHDTTSRPEFASNIAAEAMFEEAQRLKKNLSMAVAGTGGFAVVAAGISEALVATALGLAVAIVAVMFYNYFQTRIASLNGLFRIQVAKLLQSISV
ncbi:MAG: biopolymer transport protein [Deltaproteobacteria bacterium]|nr:biopolymer transport protein [Deltaproteobacteria bacterium]